MMFFRIFITFFIFLFLNFLKSESDLIDIKIDIKLNKENNIKLKDIGEDQLIKGVISGNTESLQDKNFNNAKLECDFIGRSYKGRGFSCGFAVIEDLQGFCYLSKESNTNVLIVSWNCNTTGGINGDASCNGKLNIVQGFGEFAGVTGFGKINMPLAKSIQTEISTPMYFNLKIKYPLSLKKM